MIRKYDKYCCGEPDIVGIRACVYLHLCVYVVCGELDIVNAKVNIELTKQGTSKDVFLFFLKRRV